MSVSGKKIAVLNAKLEAARITLEAGAQAIKLGGIPGVGVMACAYSRTAFLMQNVTSTPHQYFNSMGKVDKRKVKRYSRPVKGKVWVVGSNA